MTIVTRQRAWDDEADARRRLFRELVVIAQHGLAAYLWAVGECQQLNIRLIRHPAERNSKQLPAGVLFPTAADLPSLPRVRCDNDRRCVGLGDGAVAEGADTE
jgi:hypothetical protein